MLRVVVVDDSPVARNLLCEILNSAEDIEVVGVAQNGAEGVSLVSELQPDVVTMDVQMPQMDGYAATREIMVIQPTPIVVVSGSMGKVDIEKSMESLKAGALTVIGKPGSPASSSFDKSAQTLLDTVRAMADVKVVRRRPGRQTVNVEPLKATSSSLRPRLVAVAASTGGPQTLYQLFSQLSANFPLPIVLVQHIGRGFLEGFARWLDENLPLHVVIAEDGQSMQPGTIYVAPEDRHLTVAARGRLSLTDTPPVGGFRPAASVLFESAANSYGKDLIACILTGMGHDGTDGLRVVHRMEGLILAQDEESCVVFGMPAAAIEAGVVDQIGSVDEIVTSLNELTSQTS